MSQGRTRLVGSWGIDLWGLFVGLIRIDTDFFADADFLGSHTDLYGLIRKTQILIFFAYGLIRIFNVLIFEFFIWIE